MCKACRIVLMAAGFIAMSIILVVFGFVDTEIPRMGYLGMWIICAGIIYYGAGSQEILKNKDDSAER